MIPEKIKSQIKTIWKNYIDSNRMVLDTKGNPFPDIDSSRLKAIENIKVVISKFLNNQTDIYEFKTTIDSSNKRNNLWGFTATKGQMFFNQLVKNSEPDLKIISKLLRECISLPRSLDDALSKIAKLESYCQEKFEKANDKRKVANPGSVGYFLSYFWQIQDYINWPIFYTSLIKTFIELGIWETKPDQKTAYSDFYNLNNEIKQLLEKYHGKKINNWDAEHAFWNFKGNPNRKQSASKEAKIIDVENNKIITFNASFELSDYLIPRVSNLIQLGKSKNDSSALKGAKFEKLVAEIFQLMSFDVDFLGQGKGRNPDAILKLREENTAFIIDAKAYSDGYSLGLDDRAIKEYINHYCPILIKEGYKKIGFIIVSNSFKSDFNQFINDITWNTDIKRVILLTSEALLYLLAYKTKDQLDLQSIIESLISFGNPVDAKDIIQGFDDV